MMPTHRCLAPTHSALAKLGKPVHGVTCVAGGALAKTRSAEVMRGRAIGAAALDVAPETASCRKSHRGPPKLGAHRRRQA
jgi:hypothetical protein